MQFRFMLAAAIIVLVGACASSGRSSGAVACAAFDISEPCRAARSNASPVRASFPTPQPFTDCDDCPSMVRIPGQSFAVSQYEVTFTQWDACIEAGACEQQHSDRARINYPVSNVSWNDAQAYVHWLSQSTGYRYRLLTTAEWLIAAFPGGRRQNYYWGNDVPVCQPGARNGVAFDACGATGALPVGTFQPNAYGLYDMIGNVGEWLEDSYGGDNSWDFRAIIGSSYASNEESLGGRGGAYSGDAGPDTGFRVARDF
jgi:formylglycine-generating enzyme required for sulfatase activity